VYPADLSVYADALAIGTEAAEWWAGLAAFTDDAGTARFAAAIEHVDAHQEGAVGWAAVRGFVPLRGGVARGHARVASSAGVPDNPGHDQGRGIEG
jgi:hypothetical protein